MQEAIKAYNDGILKAGKRNYEGAIEEYNEAIRLDGKLACAYFGRGVAFEETGEIAKARMDFARARQLRARRR